MNIQRSLKTRVLNHSVTCWFSLILLSLASSVSIAAPTIGIADTPLYGGRAPHPNVVVSLSVEFPTVSRAYSKDQSNTFIPYVAANNYLGYFDNTKCYKYSNATPSTTSSTVQTSSEYFYPYSAANSDHSCTSAVANKLFSGNFLNWATMSAVDILRFSLTGGNRVIDSTGSDPGLGASPKTVLLRAFLPDGSISGVNNFFTTSTSNINWPPSRINSSASSGWSSSYANITPSTVLPHSNSDIYTRGCRNLLILGTTNAGSSCDSPSADIAIYRVAVQVCDATEATTRIDLCQKYTTASGTTYKPTGQVQRYADTSRFAVFGYLMDRGSSPSGCDDSTWNECRYGGVLRNKMKYVGSLTYDATLTATANAYKEINTDGTFITDPDGNAASQSVTDSGFINYINKFGGSTGLYKRRDPVSELYYEAIRYLAHLPETPEAISGTVTTAMKDGFPIMTGSDWTTDPILSKCQANYIINVADANTNDDWYLPGFTGGKTYRSAARAGPDAIGFNAITATNAVGTYESRSNLATTTISNGSYLLAGTAYWARTNDIRPDLTDKQTVTTISFDVAEIAGTVNQRQLYLAGKYGGFNDVNGDGNPFVTTNATGTVTNNSEWESSPGSGYPSNYYLASDPDKLIRGLAAAFAATQKPTGTASGLALSTTNIIYAGSGAYTVSFDPNKWSGSVAYRTLSYNNVTGVLTVSTSAVWDSGDRLDLTIGTNTATIPTNAAARKIYTMNSSGTGVAFDWASVGSDAAFSNLNIDPVTSTNDGRGQERLNYLRGDRTTNEAPNGYDYRTRASAFGDIVNSAPVYVGIPTTAITDSAYSTFLTSYKTRTKAVYVGANDGMLHAIQASTGDELFTYVPRAIASKLNKLTNSAYTHTAYVDATPAVAEAKVGSNWKTVLVSGMGAGAQGVFALDVSNPATFSTSFASKILWEFTSADDADMGNVVNKPLIVQINTAAVGSTPVYKWFAVVTGYNSPTEAAAVITDLPSRRGTIFLLALDKAAAAAWQINVNYYKIKTPFDATVADTTKPNGLSPIASQPNSNGNGDIVAFYVGDLQGNLWKIKLTGGSATWTGTTPVMYSAKPLFTAVDGSANRQPITVRPTLAKGPFNGTLILFGTGKYLGSEDLSTYDQNTFYGLFDDGGTTTSTQITGRSQLVVRTLTNTSGVLTATGSAFSYGGATAKKGWYIDYLSTATTGERSASSALVDSGIASFTTITLSADACGTGGGFIYQVNSVTGLPFGSANIAGVISNVGIPGPPQSVQLESSNSTSNNTREKISKVRKGVVVSGTSGEIKLVNFSGGSLPGTVIYLGRDRVGWREIPNWNGLAGN